ncbi:CBN-TAG-130 protein [Caenorhabditis brenneri]|uniref:CBN-TAG-130 protein n=1 Tax=Caenorhabditis brenneri TaxID=135651 RepID=G0NFF0_CAEBE|nr:CBN-TAG-130 protein [Caenorhabditis brenneri]
MKKLSIIFILIFFQIVSSQVPEVIPAKWDVLYQKETGKNMSMTIFRFRVEEQYSVARIIMSCNESTEHNPLLAVFREKLAILSLQVPLIVDNYEYSQVARTLCPFTEYKEGEAFTVEVTSSRPVHYNFRAELVQNFHLYNDAKRLVTASASEPVYLRYDIPGDVDSVAVHVDSNSSICMTVSVQKIGCPIFDLPNNVNSMGLHQTMTTSATIPVEKSRMSSFYVVFVVNTNDDLCSEISSIKPIRPTKFPLRLKSFNVTIESSMKTSDYTIPIVFWACILFLVTIVVFVYHYFDGIWERRFISRAYTHLEDNAQEERIRDFYDFQRMSEDEDLKDYDLLLDCKDMMVVRAKATLTVADLSMTPYETREQQYDVYKIALAIIGIFYNITVLQLIISKAGSLRQSGDLDECTFNFQCARPLWYFVAFNNVVSNGGYVYFGSLIIVMNYCRERSFRRLFAVQPTLAERYGLPQHSGLMTAIGLAVIMEGISSATYHVCPNNINYQFDTALMYVIGMLGKLKIWSLRHPDMVVSAYHAFGFLGMFLMAAIAGVYVHNMIFWIMFSTIYIASMMLVSLEFYFKGIWTLNLRELRNSVRMAWASSKRLSCVIPAYKARFFVILLLNLANTAVVVYGLEAHPKDFLSFLLIPFIGNLFIYIIYYILMKMIHREKIPKRAMALLMAAVISWTCAGILFNQRVSDWSRASSVSIMENSQSSRLNGGHRSKMPAISRELNKPCIFLNFYDNHDIWHLSSAFAIFFSFTAINVIDDDLMFVMRNTIKVF